MTDGSNIEIVNTGELLNKNDNPIEKLNPIEFIDADGATREVFTFRNSLDHEVKVVFYTREELPYSEDVIRGNLPVILGEPPKHRDINEWTEFVKDVKQVSGNPDPLNQDSFQVNEARKTDNTLLFVENSPVHILDLAFHLGLEGKQWRDARQMASQRNVYSDSVISLIDDMIAGTVVDGEGKIITRQNQRGEALAVMALLGDNQARISLDKKRAVLTKADQERAIQNQQFYAQKKHDLEERGARLPNHPFWATHVTSYKPEITNVGVLVRSTFDGSNGEVTRNTIHFSLDGPVSSSFGSGDWEKMSYVISGKLSEMREVNGNPLMVNPVDTYFLVNPGKPLLMPNAEVTMPGKLRPGIIRETRGNVTLYKDKNLTPEDIDILFTTYFDNPLGRLFKDQIEESLRQYFFSWLREARPQENNENLQSLHQFTHSIDIDNLFNQLRTDGIEPTIRGVLDHIDPSQFNKDISHIMEQKLETWLVEKIRNGSFYSVSFGGSDRGDKQNLELLATDWGTKGSTRSQAHSEDSDGDMGSTDRADIIFKKVREAKIKMTVWEQSEDTIKYPNMKPRLPISELNNRFIDINNRQSIMEAFRDLRLSIKPRDDSIMRPENRRMFYVAGMI